MANYSVLLETLECIINNKGKAGARKVHLHYIIDDGELQRFPLIGEHSMKKGDIWHLNLNLEFNNKIIIALEEACSSTEENDLGVITINGLLPTAKNSFTNALNKWNYQLSYCHAVLCAFDFADVEYITTESE